MSKRHILDCSPRDFRLPRGPNGGNPTHPDLQTEPQIFGTGPLAARLVPHDPDWSPASAAKTNETSERPVGESSTSNVETVPGVTG